MTPLVQRPATTAADAHRPHTAVPAVLCVVLLLAFALFTFVDPPAGDHEVNRLVAAVAAWRIWSTTGLLDGLALFGEPFMSAVLATVLGTVLAIRGHVLGAALVVVALVLFTGIESILRVRLEALPWADVVDVLRQPRGRGLMASSYPSGHVGRLVLLAGMAVVCLPRRAWLPGALVVLVLGLLVSVQRVLASAHTGSDGVGGLLLGGGLAAAFAVAFPLAGMLQTRAIAWLRGRASPLS